MEIINGRIDKTLMSSRSGSKKIFKAGVGYTVGNYMLKGLTFFSIPLFTRLLTTSDYGQFNTFIAYESIVFVVIGLALHASFKNAKYKYKHNFNRYVSTCITLGLISFSVWTIAINAIYPAISEMIGFSRTVVNLLLISSMSNAFIQYYNVYVGIDYEYKKFLTISFINAISGMLFSVLLICTVFHDKRYLGRIWGNVLPLLFISIYIIITFFRKSKPELNREYIKYGIKFSLPIIPHGISQVILSQFDRIMIRSMIGMSEAGLYSFSYNIYTIIQVTATSLDNVWGTWFFEAASKKRYEEIKRNSSDYMIGMMLFSASILLVSPEIIKLVSPSSYWNSIYCVIPIVIGGYFSFLYLLPVQVEYYFEKTKFIALGTCAAAVLNILLNAIFIPRFGYIAAAYTTLMTYFLYFLFHYLLSIYFSKRKYFNEKTILICILVILVTGVVTFEMLQRTFVRWSIALTFCLIIFVYYNWRFAFVEKIKQYFSN